MALGDIHLCSRGRRGTWSHSHSFHVAGVALTALGGLWWRTRFSAVAVDAAALCVAGVALGDIPPSLCVAGVALGDRRGTWRHPASSPRTSIPPYLISVFF